ncbi:MAG: hypothetical protein DRN68_03205 [Thaumarchaeota archaeon]|nr:MAG: hypothetical protein DRN68_03205 [Nitrososphaerota archaeon]
MAGRRRWFRLMIIAALVARIIPAPFFGHPWDMYIWLKSGELGLNQVNIYLLGDPVDYPWGFYAYPPTWLYWLILTTFISRLYPNLNFHVLMIKLPIIISDILVGILAYRIASRLGFDERKSLLIMGIWLFNPITYFMSSIWGMFDSIAVLFMLISIKYIIDEKYIRSAIAAGIGIAVKILPALILLPTLAHLLKSGKLDFRNFILKIALPAAAVFLIISTPFLTTPIEYFNALFHHTKSVGGFTYWIAVSTLVNLSNFWYIPFIVFLIVTVYIYRKIEIGFDNDKYIDACAATVAVFLATSPKVNIQYTLTLIPLLLLSKSFWAEKHFKRNFMLLIASAVLWFASSSTILYGYDLNYLGRLYIMESYELRPEYIINILSGMFGGTRFVALSMDFANFKKIDLVILNKWNILLTVAIVSFGLLCILPTPSGVKLHNAPIRVGIPESADSAFIPGSSGSVSQFLKHYDVNYVVLSFSPDFVNTYQGYEPEKDATRYMRFKTAANRWKYRDVKWLIDELHSKGVKVLLGVYLRKEKVKYHYGVQGFAVDWVKSHPEILGFQDVLLFNSTLNINGKNILYADYFSMKVKSLISDFGFDGVYLMDWNNWKIKGDKLSYILPLLENLKSSRCGEIFVEGVDSTNDVNSTLTLVKNADYVILKTAPWVNRIYYVRTDEVSIKSYQRYLSEVLEKLSVDEKRRLLYGIYVFDYVDGWFTPAFEAQREVNAFYQIGVRSGYAIYHSSRYIPYKMTVGG